MKLTNEQMVNIFAPFGTEAEAIRAYLAETCREANALEVRGVHLDPTDSHAVAFFFGLLVNGNPLTYADAGTRAYRLLLQELQHDPLPVPSTEPPRANTAVYPSAVGAEAGTSNRGIGAGAIH